VKSASSACHRFNLATIAVFLVALALPLGGFLFRKPEQPGHENRRLSPPPQLVAERWAVQTFPPMFEAYFNDRVGFRKKMLRLRRSVVFDAFGDSPADLAWVGRDGWLYVNPLGPGVALPAAAPSPEPAVEAWAAALADRHRELAARGVRYVVLVAREKSGVYPEYLPATYQRHPVPDLVTPLLDRLAAAGVPAIDALPHLLRAKAEQSRPLFFQKDSHWTDAGAFAAYAALGAELERLVPGYRAKPMAAFRTVPVVRRDADLAVALGLSGERAAEPCEIFTEPESGVRDLPAADVERAVEAAGDRLRSLPTRLTETPNRRVRGVLLHDSFGVDLGRLLASDFARFASAGTYGLPMELIDAENPDVVVQLFVERALRSKDEGGRRKDEPKPRAIRS
jgi:hypothetical protein